MQTELSGSEKFWYYTACICMFGGLYFAKLAAKKAVCEVNAAAASARTWREPDVRGPGRD